MKRVVAYCRVSTASSDQANSFENQKSYFEREIKNNEDYEFVGIYADKGKSGLKLQRPEFDRMLIDAGLEIRSVENSARDTRKNYIEYVTVVDPLKNPKFDIILVKNTSRFARNVGVVQIIRQLQRKKVYIHFLDVNAITDNEEDMAKIQLFLTFDERESTDKSKKVRFGIEESSKKGVIRANSKLYGYKYIKNENRLEVIESEAQNVRTIFELYSNGKGIRQIINYLTENKIYTRAGKPFCKTAISRVLDNEKYMGMNNALKYDTGIIFNKNSYPKKRQDYQVVPSDKIPPHYKRRFVLYLPQLEGNKD